jgi:hypothetical protein
MSYDITTTEVEFDENSEEYMIQIPQDLLEEMEWREGDILEWQFWDYDGLPGLRLHKVGE